MFFQKRMLVISFGVMLFASFSALPLAAQLNCTENCDPTIAVVPVAANANFLIDGSEITVVAGTLVYLELHLAHWDSDRDGAPLLSAYQVTIDTSSYSSGVQGELVPLTLPCVDAYICVTQILAGHCTEFGCCIDGSCADGFFDLNRDDYVFSGLNPYTQTDLSFSDGRFLATSFVGGVDDPGTTAYAGTFLLEVPPDAVGTFTVKVSQAPADTHLMDETGNPIEPLVFGAAKITVAPGDELFVRKNRFLTIHTGRARRRFGEAIRVKLADLDGDFAVFNGTTLWVGEPKKVSAGATRELLDPVDSGDPFLWVAKLECSPYYTDWTQFPEPIHAFHELVVPNSSYEIQLILVTRSPSNEENFSSPFVVSTPRWGDVVGRFDAAGRVWPSPDGSVDVVSDVIAILDAFRGLPSAPIKIRLDLDREVPDGLINITDVVMALNAFRGAGYPFAPSVADPCP